MMQYQKLGSSGLMISRLSFGSWVTFGTQVDTRLAKNLLAQAYEAGINFFDNAEVYAGGKSETMMGEAIASLGWTRDSYCVSSKAFWGGDKPTQSGLSRKHLVDACHAALKRLRVDYLDMFFCHRPDLDTPVEETVRTMNDLIHQGKILYWGTSEWSAQRITEAYAVARQYGLIGPTMEQPEYNMFNREKVERDYLPLYREYGMGTTIWSPLCSGILSGKYQGGIPKDSRMAQPGYEWLKKRLESEVGKDRIKKTNALIEIADGLGAKVSQLAIAWCLRKPFVSTVILGASKSEQLTENLGALSVLPKLNDKILNQMESILSNTPDEEESFK